MKEMDMFRRIHFLIIKRNNCCINFSFFNTIFKKYPFVTL